MAHYSNTNGPVRASLLLRFVVSLQTKVWLTMCTLLGQVEDKSREIERLRGSLGTAEARLGGLEGRLLSS